MKPLFALLISALIVTGAHAADQKSVVTSTNPDLLSVSDSKPAGYPKSYVKKDPLGNCTKYDEDYVPGPVVKTHKTWRKITHIQSLGTKCPPDASTP
ncbi:hypothetical protein [Dyella caseinilytica]|uniref:Uncharacterized protein n=1 Tax=Dyella caseinilytica TaxID=1849581 RepID=A0ABX7GZM3_9GAMM|nr:hypothetical protein [Dyella caseinilytica]QRN55383.1 hypothetical protein ISN74_08700 [Dyella caseinilytica]GGA01314.1 hypothetical protein GCM10011408_23210 [Dyella caseinilytica]